MFPTRFFALLVVVLQHSLMKVSAKPSDDGYDEAKDLWRDKGYRCSVKNLEKYWKKVKKEVYDFCEEEFSGKDEEKCEKGAEDFVLENEKKCAFEYGLKLAEDLWDDKNYRCNRHDLDDFKKDLKYTYNVDDDCEDEFDGYDSDVVDSCMEGAEAYVDEFERRECKDPIYNGNNGGPFKLGYGEAEELWEDKNYRCTKNDLENFWYDVERKVFRDCQREYSRAKDVEDCEEGAHDFMGCRAY